MKPETRKLLILGSTGSIGTQALEVAAHVNDLAKAGRSAISFEVVGLAAGKNGALLAEQARRFSVRQLALAEADAVMDGARLPGRATLRRGPSAAEELVRSVDCDLVLAAMVGSAGIPATFAAIDIGRVVALANKETLVAGGELAVAASLRGGRQGRLIAVDSEHAALFQALSDYRAGANKRCLSLEDEIEQGGARLLPQTSEEDVVRGILTASGGAFRNWTKDQIERATPEEALKHPTWSMGAKVTIDSAGLMNKGLELIEARWLFGLPAAKLGVLVHPQCIVHAIAEFVDGSCIAQLAPPDMRLPIQRALTWPRTLEGAARRVNWSETRSLEFSPPDLSRFPALGMAYKVLELGGTSGATLNAANEEAVSAFVDHRIGFGVISRVVEAAIENLPIRPLTKLDDVWNAEAEARVYVRERIARGLAK